MSARKSAEEDEGDEGSVCFHNGLVLMSLFQILQYESAVFLDRLLFASVKEVAKCGPL